MSLFEIERLADELDHWRKRALFAEQQWQLFESESKRRQPVVDAARLFIEPAPECPEPGSSATHDTHDCETARFHRLWGAVQEFDSHA